MSLEQRNPVTLSGRIDLFSGAEVFEDARDAEALLTPAARFRRSPLSTTTYKAVMGPALSRGAAAARSALKGDICKCSELRLDRTHQPRHQMRLYIALNEGTGTVQA